MIHALTLGLSIILLLSAPVADARAIEWYHFLHHADRIAPSNETPAAPTPHSTTATTTPAQAAAVTSPPQLPDGELLVKRAAGVTCGYYQGSSGSPLVCATGADSCFTNAKSSARGCCSSAPCNDGYGIPTACVDYAGCQRGSCAATRTGTMYCDNAKYPYCAKFTFVDVRMTMIDCRATSVAGVVEMMADYTTAKTTAKPTVKVASSVLETTSSSSRAGTVSASSSATPSGTSAAGTSGTSSTQLPEKSTTGGEASGGMSLENRIALGIGLGIGVPTAIATIWMCLRGH